MSPKLWRYVQRRSNSEATVEAGSGFQSVTFDSSVLTKYHQTEFDPSAKPDNDPNAVKAHSGASCSVALLKQCGIIPAEQNKNRRALRVLQEAWRDFTACAGE